MRVDRRPHSGEEGSALIIALVFITTISLIVSAILSFTDVGLRASKSYNFKEKAKSSYAAEGAVSTAIQRYATTGPCDNLAVPPINGQGVIVRCEGPPPAGARATQPVNSLLSLGGPTDLRNGITSSQELRLLGDVFSNTTVSTTATMVVQGDVSAIGDCTGPIQTRAGNRLRCANSTPPDAADPSRGRDPDYTPATNAVPMWRPVPTCPTGWLVEVKPGYYDDAAGFTALTGSPSCNDKVVWFQPGTYYFDFTFRGGPDTWKVDNPSVVVVGGTANWDTDPAKPRPTVNVPGSCKTSGEPGVQLIAGGGTHLEVTKGRMELCATPSATDQQIALFGLAPERADHSLEATNITANTGFKDAINAQTINAQTIDEVPETRAKAELDSTATPALTTASLSFEAFRPAVPSGSVIDAVGLHAEHDETGDPVTIMVTADFPGSACGPSNPVPLPAGGQPDLDLEVACGLKTPEGFAGLKLTYAVALTSGGKATARVDGVVVNVAYRAPVTRKPTAVLDSTGFNDALKPPLNALEIGEQPDRLTADAALTSTTRSASITLAGMGDPPLPAGATIDSAVLRVAHQDQGDTGKPKVSVPFASGTCADLEIEQRPAAVTDDRIDLKACGLDSADKLKDLRATFTATLNTGGLAAVSRLDGMWLEVVSSGATGSPSASVRQPANARSTSTDPGSTVFAPADAARVIGGTPPSTADATLSGAANTAVLSVDGFNEGIPLPPGSKISSAKLRVTHNQDANVASAGVTADFPGSTCPREVIPNAAALPYYEGADLTLCGLTSPERLAALTARYDANRTTVATPANQVPTTATQDGGFPTAEPSGLSINNETADATLATGQTTTASTTLKGYDRSPPPPGATIDTATLRVAHQEDGDIGPVTVTVTIPGSNCAPQALTPSNGAIAVTPVNLQGCGLTDPAQLAGLEVVYKADLAPGDAKAAIAKLDGVELALTYRPPAVDKLDGIELAIVFQAPTLTPLCPAGPPSGCGDLLTVAPEGGDPAALPPVLPDTASRFVAGGTVYAPSAGVDISMYGLDHQVLRRGLIARSIRLGLQPIDTYNPTGAVPPEIVTFTAYPDQTLKPATAGPSGGFTGPDNAKSLREQPVTTANAALDDTNPTPSLELRDYGPTLPGGASIDGVVLRVRHQDDGNTVTVMVKAGGKTCFDRPLAPSPTTADFSEDQVELQVNEIPGLPSECTFDTPAKLSGVTVTYTVARALGRTTATAKLDGITLETLSGPLVRADVTFDRAKATVEAWSVLR